MNASTSESINTLQFTFLIHGAQVGTGILTLPLIANRNYGFDGLISILLAFTVSLAGSLLIIHIMRAHPDQTLFEINRAYFGRFLGSAINAVVILYLFLVLMVVFIRTINILKIWVLQEAGVMQLALLFLATIYFSVTKGLTVIGRFAVFVFFFTLWMPLLLLMPLEHINWLNMLPVLKQGVWPILEHTSLTFPVFLGFELIFFIYPYLSDKTKAVRAVISANLVTMIVYLHIAATLYLFYSPDEEGQFLYPLIHMLKTIEFPVVERFDVFFFTYYVMILLREIYPYFYSVVYGLRHLSTPKISMRLLSALLLCGIFIFYLFEEPSYFMVQEMEYVKRYSGVILALAFPLFLWGYTLLFKRVRRRYGP